MILTVRKCSHAFSVVSDEGFCAKTRVVDMFNEILYSSQNRFIVFSLGEDVYCYKGTIFIVQTSIGGCFNLIWVSLLNLVAITDYRAK